MKVLSSIDGRIVLLIDNGKNALSVLPGIIEDFNKSLKFAPIILLSVRTNFRTRIHQYISKDEVTINDYKIPNLDDKEIDYLIRKLDENNLLGILKGKSDGQRKREFRVRANRQILVAMKEATNGKSFSTIMSDEYNSIEPREAQILCVCIALSSELSYSNSKQDLVGFSDASHIEALNYLDNVLQGTIMWVDNGSRFMLRHKILADHIIRKCVDSKTLMESYIRVLSVLAPELTGSDNRSKKFNLFKALTNHQTLYRRFKSDIEKARQVYDSISQYFADDSHFWLQYGSLELEGRGGNLQLAENYLSQAESLAPSSDYVLNANCNLKYKLATSSSLYEEAFELYEEANLQAQKQILAIGKEEPYIYQIYCVGRFQFIRKWITDKTQKKKELDELRGTIKVALTFHPFNDKLKVSSDAINRAYVQLGIDADLEDPDIPDFMK